jgi:hypothetical protein
MILAPYSILTKTIAKDKSDSAILHLPVRLIVLDYKADKFFPCPEQEPAEYEPQAAKKLVKAADGTSRLLIHFIQQQKYPVHLKRQQVQQYADFTGVFLTMPKVMLKMIPVMF